MSIYEEKYVLEKFTLKQIKRLRSDLKALECDKWARPHFGVAVNGKMHWQGNVQCLINLPDQLKAWEQELTEIEQLITEIEKRQDEIEKTTPVD